MTKKKKKKKLIFILTLKKKKKKKKKKKHSYWINYTKVAKTNTATMIKAKVLNYWKIYAIRMQVVGTQNNRAALQELFQRTYALCADINDPKSMSIIKELSIFYFIFFFEYI